MLVPSGRWQWYIDSDSGHLALALDNDLHCITAYKAKHLSPGAVFPMPFSVEHTEQFYAFTQVVETSQCSEAQCAHIVLNAVAATSFHKPVALKSWFYQPFVHGGAAPTGLSELFTESDKAVVLIVEQDASRSTCMVVDGPLRISDDKTLSPFTLVNVCNDRLHPFVGQSETRKRA